MDVDRVSRELKKVPPMIAKIEKARGECASRIKVAAERLEEVNRAIEGQLANKLAITRDLQASRDHDAGLHTLMSASKVEEKSMMVHSRSQKQSSVRRFEGTTADLSRKSREAERGFSGGPGSTCTVAEALRRTKLIQSRSPQINETTYSFGPVPP